MRRIVLPALLSLFIPLFATYAAGEVDLLWQGLTYTPPFYKGRSLWSNEARLTVTAVSNLAGRDPAALYYRWSKNGTVLGSLSGINKRSLTFVDNVLSLPIEIKVDLRNGQDGEILGSSSIFLTPASARILVVEENPLYGLMLNRTVGSTFTLEEAEVTFAAIPLFATVTMRNAPAITYTWATNTGDVRNGSEVTYRAPEDSAGSSAISLRMVNSRILAQPPEKSFLVQFGNTNDF